MSSLDQRQSLFPPNQEDYFDCLGNSSSLQSSEDALNFSQDTIASEEFFAPLTNESEIIQKNVNEIEPKLNSKLETISTRQNISTMKTQNIINDIFNIRITFQKSVLDFISSMQLIDRTMKPHLEVTLQPLYE
ncbi:4300_t:CDS:2 [Cetraspora pellucida]|uniref:4300_t:CDS:1 n=1 Tax=Cetraspora pellucida TaxID=1433469 RepID=A0ACA9LXI4_9GLOM|nr:4300_t:CDS:2 [Cetraspora pellucida]